MVALLMQGFKRSGVNLMNSALSNYLQNQLALKLWHGWDLGVEVQTHSPQSLGLSSAGPSCHCLRRNVGQRLLSDASHSPLELVSNDECTEISPRNQHAF